MDLQKEFPCCRILDLAFEGALVVDGQGIILYANPALTAWLGYGQEELSEIPLKSITSLPREEVGPNGAGTKRGACSFKAKGGKEIQAEVQGLSMEAGEGHGPLTLILVQPPTWETFQESAFLREIVTACPDGIMAVDRQGIVRLFNEACERLLGYRQEEVVGRLSITQVYQPSHLAREVKKRLYSQDYGGVGRLEELEVEVLTRDGRPLPIRLSAAILWNEAGEEIGSVGFFHDLTARREMEARLRDLSIRDSLTGLFNRGHFYLVLSEEMERARRYRRPLSMIGFDLDNFKTYNDTLGHLEGDQILRTVGESLRASLRRTDRAFRYGGDEFMVILPETGLERAVTTAERIRKNFAGRWPHRLTYGDIHLPTPTLSQGVAELSPDEEIEAFIKRVDLTMYEAKKAGGDQIMVAGRKLGRPPGKKGGKASPGRKS